MWGPPVISWFISPSNYTYKYHKPKLLELYTNWTLSWGPHIVGPHIVGPHDVYISIVDTETTWHHRGVNHVEPPPHRRPPRSPSTEVSSTAHPNTPPERWPWKVPRWSRRPTDATWPIFWVKILWWKNRWENPGRFFVELFEDWRNWILVDLKISKSQCLFLKDCFFFALR